MTETQELDNLIINIMRIHKIEKDKFPDEFLFNLYLLKKEKSATYLEINNSYESNKSEIIRFAKSVNPPTFISELRYGLLVVKENIDKIKQG